MSSESLYAHLASKVNLRKLVTSLALLSALVAVLNTFVASYRVQRHQLMHATLEANRTYAAKLAQSTDSFLKSALRELQVSAGVIAGLISDEEALQKEAHRVRLQNESFNSVVVVDDTGLVLATSPDVLNIRGKQLVSAANEQALRQRAPMISDPFVSLAGNYLINISQPIVSEEGHYLGYVSGTIYLKEENVLGSLLGEHYYQDGSSLYVVDRSGRILYHPDRRRIGERVAGNMAIQSVMRGESGAQQILNSQGVEMLAGYAHVPANGWGIISQRPLASTLAPLSGLMRDVLLHTTPLALISLIVIWLCAREISRPLWLLARYVRGSDTGGALGRVASVRPWYFEVASLKQAVLSSLFASQAKIERLSRDSSTDPLTGVLNRRGLDERYGLLRAAQLPGALLALDLDRFKRINDTFGHDTGDLVLKAFADILQMTSREADVVARVGGEEFVVLLPGADLSVALSAAERIRERVAAHDMPASVGQVTVSIGVTVWPAGIHALRELQIQADKALYEAKDSGRNCVRAYKSA